MREIKFRGYDLYSESWVYGAYIKHIDSTPCLFPSKEEEEKWYKEHTKHLIAFDGFSDWWMPRGIDVCTSIVPDSIGQSTGLLDVNKKEIFEGDFIKFSSETIDDECFNNRVGKVVFENCAFWLNFSDVSLPLWSNQMDKYVIVGNVYENPEIEVN